MEPKRPCSHLLPFVTLVLLLQKSLSAMNPNYEACKPYECGNLSISYPFYVPHKQPSFCGSQGFEVSCNPQKQAIIILSGDNYTVNSVSYEDLSVSITNSAFSDSVFGCLSSSLVHNLSLGPDSKFSFPSQKHKEVLLLGNCTSSSSNSSYTRIKCKDQDHTRTLFAVEEEDFRGSCNGTVAVPYEYDGTATGLGGLEGLLRKGVVLEYTANNCNLCQNSGGRCGLGNTTQEFWCFCPDRDHRAHCRPPKRGIPLGFILVLAFSGLASIILVLVTIIFWRRIKIKCLSTFHSTRKILEHNKNFENVLKDYAAFAPKRYTYSDIKKMTNSLAEKLGEGGFGGVYKGKLLDGRLVAVKLLKNSKGDGEGFINEVVSIGRTNHVNVVTLLGFCLEGHKRALVYEYMANGSLEKFRHGKANIEQTLPLETLFQIVLGIARGLEYLHRGCKTRILHFDIKPHNILLDEEFRPKISDFGLAKLTPQDKQSKISMSGARGTIGYIAPEVFNTTFGDVSHKADVYSYGMMVLEVIGSRIRANTQAESSSELYFPEYIYKQLERGQEAEIGIATNENDNQLKRKMIVVSLWCIQPIPSSRPSMSMVVQMLEGSSEAIEIPHMPTFSSPPSLQWDLETSSKMSL